MLTYFHYFDRIENTELNSSSSALIFRSCVPIEKPQVCPHLNLSVHFSFVRIESFLKIGLHSIGVYNCFTAFLVTVYSVKQLVE